MKNQHYLTPVTTNNQITILIIFNSSTIILSITLAVAVTRAPMPEGPLRVIGIYLTQITPPNQ